jgi:hypothetical protein
MDKNKCPKMEIPNTFGFFEKNIHPTREGKFFKRKNRDFPSLM